MGWTRMILGISLLTPSENDLDDCWAVQLVRSTVSTAGVLYRYGYGFLFGLAAKQLLAVISVKVKLKYG